jgi:hypothetical protein
VPIEPRRVPVPSLYRYVLLEAVDGVDLPLQEKMAFDVGFRYESVPCTLALQKFGVRLYVATDVPESNVREFSNRLLGKLTKGVELVEKQVLRPLADQQLADGNVTIANQRGFLRTTYEHFRDEARRAFGAATAPRPSPKSWWQRWPPWRKLFSVATDWPARWAQHARRSSTKAAKSGGWRSSGTHIRRSRRSCLRELLTRAIGGPLVERFSHLPCIGTRARAFERSHRAWMTVLGDRRSSAPTPGQQRCRFAGGLYEERGPEAATSGV